MQIQEFISNYREAFGAEAQLPVLFFGNDYPHNVR